MNSASSDIRSPRVPAAAVEYWTDIDAPELRRYANTGFLHFDGDILKAHIEGVQGGQNEQMTGQLSHSDMLGVLYDGFHVEELIDGVMRGIRSLRAIGEGVIELDVWVRGVGGFEEDDPGFRTLQLRLEDFGEDLFPIVGLTWIDERIALGVNALGIAQLRIDPQTPIGSLDPATLAALVAGRGLPWIDSD